ncbi:addiction module antidote protein, HigA family [Cupriavidus lacunae]|uniref:Addiction module antidote protein, HigA family n=2 Tax=Cupriavidus TaxID=106589 RepID=A0A370NNJ6_9BURK|nr:addiction module antidote protein, HigA family [Cupriavidus lacunae]
MHVRRHRRHRRRLPGLPLKDIIMTRMHNPPHPGAVLADWLDGMDDMTITAFAEHIGVTRATLSRILNGHSSITPDIAIRLEEALGASREMWSGMQMAYDLWVAAQKPRKRIRRLVRPAAKAEEADLA